MSRSLKNVALGKSRLVRVSVRKASDLESLHSYWLYNCKIALLRSWRTTELEYKLNCSLHSLVTDVGIMDPAYTFLAGIYRMGPAFLSMMPHQWSQKVPPNSTARKYVVLRVISRGG